MAHRGSGDALLVSQFAAAPQRPDRSASGRTCGDTFCVHEQIVSQSGQAVLAERLAPSRAHQPSLATRVKAAAPKPKGRLRWLEITVYKQLGAHEVAVHRRGDGEIATATNGEPRFQADVAADHLVVRKLRARDEHDGLLPARAGNLHDPER